MNAEIFNNGKAHSADKSVLKSCKTVHVEIVQIEGPSDLPVQVTRCLNDGEETLKALVFLNGGPGAPPQTLPDTMTSIALSAGYDVISPLYSGTWSRSDNTPVKGSDFASYDKITPAIRDVRDTLAWTKKRYPHVILGGSSAGGYLAAASCTGRCANGLFMLAPLIQSPKDLWVSVVQDSKEVVALDKQDIRNQLGQSADLSKLSSNDAQNYRKFLAIGFFGQKFYNRSLYDLLRKDLSSVPKLIVVGLDDKRVGIDQLSAIEKDQQNLGLNLVTIPGMDHQTIAGEASQSFLYSFLRDPKGHGRLSNPDGKCILVKAGMSKVCPDS